MDEHMVTSLQLFLTQNASARHRMTSFDEVFLGKNFVLESQPKKHVDFRRKARDPSPRPRGSLLNIPKSRVPRGNRIEPIGVIPPNQFVLVIAEGQGVEHNHNGFEVNGDNREVPPTLISHVITNFVPKEVGAVVSPKLIARVVHKGALRKPTV